MRLCDALDVQRGDVVSFVGAGGKTSALIRLGRELAAAGWRVLATTTTRIATEELDEFPWSTRWRFSLLRGSRELATLLDDHGFVFVYQEIRNDKATGIPYEYVSRLMDEMNADVLLVEADGSRRLPLKTPYSYEPVWPPDTTIAVPVAGLDVLGKPLDETHVYNPQPALERYGFRYGEPIQPAWLAQIVRDETLGLKDVPEGARVVALLNKADMSGRMRSRARRVAQMILRSPRVDSVAIGAMQFPADPVFEVQRRIAAVVLAAGLSTRMGQSKMLLSWGERTVIEAVVQRLIPFHFSQIVVVTGFESKTLKQILTDYPVKTVFNTRYEKGEMRSSLKAGLRALAKATGACLVVMGDQPQIPTRVILQVLRTASQNTISVVAPYYQGQRGHPILIPRKTWPQLLRMRRGAPRDVIKQYPILKVPVKNDAILRDIDTPEQYSLEKRRAGLE